MSGTYSSDGKCGKNVSGQLSEMLSSLSAKDQCPMNIGVRETNTATKLVTDKVVSYVTVTDDRVNLTFSFPKSDFDFMTLISRQVEEIRSKNDERVNKSYTTSSVCGSSEDALNYQEDAESNNSKSLNRSFLSEITQKCDINNTEDILTSYMTENICLRIKPEISEFLNDGGSEQQNSLKAYEQRAPSSPTAVLPVSDKKNCITDAAFTQAENTNKLDVKCSKVKEIEFEDTACNSIDSNGAMESIGVQESEISTMFAEVEENTLYLTSSEGPKYVMDETSAELENTLHEPFVEVKENTVDTSAQEEENVLDATSVGEKDASDETSEEVKTSYDATFKVIENTVYATSNEEEENVHDAMPSKVEENAQVATSAEMEENVLNATSAEMEENVLDATSAEMEENVLYAKSVEETDASDETSEEVKTSYDATFKVVENTVHATSNEVEENVHDAMPAKVEENAQDATSAEMEENVLNATSVEEDENALDSLSADEEKNSLDSTSAKGEEKAVDKTFVNEEEKSLDAACDEEEENAFNVTSTDVKESALYTSSTEEESTFDETSGKNVLNAMSADVEENTLDETYSEVKENGTDNKSADVKERVLNSTSVERGEKVLDAAFAEVEENALQEILAEVEDIGEKIAKDEENTFDETSAKGEDSFHDTSANVEDTSLKVEIKTFDLTSTEDKITLDATFGEEVEKNIHAAAKAIKTLDTTTVDVERNLDAISAEIRKTLDAKSDKVENFSIPSSAREVKTLDATSVAVEVRTQNGTPAKVEVETPDETSMKEDKAPYLMSTTVESALNATTGNVGNDLETTSARLEGNGAGAITTEVKENSLDRTYAGVKGDSTDKSSREKEFNLNSSSDISNVQDSTPSEVRKVPDPTSVELGRNVEDAAYSKRKGNVLDTSSVESERNTQEVASAKGEIIPDETSTEVENTVDPVSFKIGGNIQEAVPTEVKENISDSTPSEVDENVREATATIGGGNVPVASSSEMINDTDATHTANCEDNSKVTSSNIDSVNNIKAENHDSVDSVEEKYLLGESMSYQFKKGDFKVSTDLDKRRISQRASSLPKVLKTKNIHGSAGENEIKEKSFSSDNSKNGNVLKCEPEKNNEKDSVNVKDDIKNKRRESRSKMQFDDVDSAPTRARSKNQSSSLLRVPEDSVVSKFNRSASTGKTSPLKRSLRSRSLDPSPTKTPGNPSLDKKLTTPSKASSCSVDMPESEKRMRQSAIKKEIKIPMRSSPRKLARAASVPKETSKREETSLDGAKVRSAQSSSTVKAKKVAKK